MRLFIPEISTKLRLDSSWTFTLHYERRNFSLYEALEIPFDPKWHRDQPPTMVTLATGTDLTVDRVYIRNRAKDFSSVTFLATIPGVPPKKGPFGRTGVRFWAKLVDVNEIHFTLQEE